MVGLSVVLEAKCSSISEKSPQVINKTTVFSSINKHSSFQEATFLDLCFLCRKRLLPGKDIYMYKGDRAFCSVECRCKQILMDEEESIQIENCSLAAMRPTPSASSSSSSSQARYHQKGARNRSGGFAY
ncbi:hypothetical protein VNO77_23631 [Canavalia gladiata]|uniref:FLZ-type domain-containing protein n=1 Tax=Canavalia gladiata TaxID=3824 RepID=A0AAN9QBW2_CANGL